MFYLPVVTPWWFANIVVHLIRVMAREHDVHVLVPPLWRGTGIGPDQLALVDDLTHVQWHLLDGPDHPKLRDDASAEDDLFEFVAAIEPDLTLCRSADIKSPARFPGVVRYIMEGAAPPLETAAHWVTLSSSLFDYGVMPEIPQVLAARLDAFATTFTQSLSKRGFGTRAEWLAQYGLDPKATIIGLPLEYEHEENFFGQHHRYPDNTAFITGVADALPDGAVLAVTNHPLNELYGDNSGIKAVLETLGSRAVMLPSTATAGSATLALAKHCDGMVVGNSKSWAACAAYGTALMRLSAFTTGGWANAYTSLEPFFADVARGTAITADPAKAQRWFTYHLLDQVFDPADPSLQASDIINRITKPVDPARWVAALSRYHSQGLEQAA